MLNEYPINPVVLQQSKGNECLAKVLESALQISKEQLVNRCEELDISYSPMPWYAVPLISLTFGVYAFRVNENYMGVNEFEDGVYAVLQCGSKILHASLLVVEDVAVMVDPKDLSKKVSFKSEGILKGYKFLYQ